MKILVYTKLTPMGFCRLIWPAMALQAQGCDVSIVDGENPANALVSVDRAGRTVDVLIPDADVIVIQRVTQSALVEAMRRWQAAGIRVVVDMDDNLRDITPGQNPGAFKLLHQSGDQISHRWAGVACDMADAVTVSTDALADMYRHPHRERPTVLRNCIPQAYLSIPRYAGDLVIGWTGAVSFRNDDPGVVGGALARLQRDGYRFGMVGPLEGVEAAFRLAYPPVHWGPASHHEYPLRMACHTVGIAPLKDNAFNQGKSWLKVLEFASLGVPVVASDMPEYRRFGWAMLAANPRQWYARLKRLLTEPVLREDMSAHGRIVAGRWTYERRCGEWWQAWTGKPE